MLGSQDIRNQEGLAVSIDAINSGSKLNGLSMSISLNRVKDTHWLAWRAIRKGFVDFRTKLGCPEGASALEMCGWKKESGESCPRRREKYS